MVLRAVDGASVGRASFPPWTGWGVCASRRWSRANPAGPWRLRGDVDGITCAIGGRSTSYDWSAIAQVVEGEAAIVLAQAYNGQGIPFVSLPGAHLSPDDRASIRQRTFRRLRVAGSPAAG